MLTRRKFKNKNKNDLDSETKMSRLSTTIAESQHDTENVISADIKEKKLDNFCEPLAKNSKISEPEPESQLNETSNSLVSVITSKNSPLDQSDASTVGQMIKNLDQNSKHNISNDGSDFTISSLTKDRVRVSSFSIATKEPNQPKTRHKSLNIIQAATLNKMMPFGYRLIEDL